MGYYTRFELEVVSDEGNLIEQFRESCEDAKYAIEDDGAMYDATKWYDCDEDLKHFSRKHPDALFILSGEGEDNDDIWKAYFRNGRMYKEKAKIVFKEFNESKLK